MKKFDYAYRPLSRAWESRGSVDIDTTLRSTAEIVGNHDMMIVVMSKPIINHSKNYTMKPGEGFGVCWLDFHDQFSVPVRFIAYRVPHVKCSIGESHD
jgi:hypothetical protein